MKPPKEATRPAPLREVLDQNQVVQDRVERAGDDLSSVNTELRQELDKGAHAEMESAVKQSESIETEVRDVAQELVAVNEALAEEVAERQDLEERLVVSEANLRDARHDALHDEATGLPNLGLFTDRLRNAIAQAQRHRWRLAVLFIDLDDFKSVNDTHGHDLGDLVLATVGRRLQSVVRGGDTVSRRSGDEFLVLMLEVTDDAGVAAFAEKILATLEEPLEDVAVRVCVRASIGIAVYPDDGDSAAAMLKRADAAMYAAKREQSRWALASALPSD